MSLVLVQRSAERQTLALLKVEVYHCQDGLLSSVQYGDSLHWEGFSFSDLVWGVQGPPASTPKECHVALANITGSVFSFLVKNLQQVPEIPDGLPHASDAFPYLNLQPMTFAHPGCSFSLCCYQISDKKRLKGGMF